MFKLKTLSILPLVLLSSACTLNQPYEPPKEEEPHALVKLKYKYSEIVDKTALGARMNIRQDAQSDDERYQSAFNDGFGMVTSNGKNPEIPMTAVKVHPGKKTDVSMAVYFYWYTTHTYTIMVNNMPQIQTQQVYNERACTAKVSFTPEKGKVYILDYSSPNVDRDCRGNAYEQINQGGGNFKLVKVGSSSVD